MADLHPTKTRLALLEGIDRGEVTGYPSHATDYVDYAWRDSQRWRAVNGRIAEFIRAGWVPEYVPGEVGRRPDFKVQLTDAGRKVLEAGRG